MTVRSAEVRPPEPAPAVSLPRSGAIEALDVPGDLEMLVIVGEDTGRPIIHLHGMCTASRPDLAAWGSSVSAYGTIIALSGDMACSSTTGSATWTTDVSAIDARVDRAIDTVRAHAVKLDERELVVIGASLGASRAMALAARFPAKYTRLVLIGAPEVPSAKTLAATRAVALLAGEKEPQARMLHGTAALASSGLRARYWELPGAVHGSYGPDGSRIMADAVAFVTEQ